MRTVLDLSDVELFESYDLLKYGKPRLAQARYVFDSLDDLDLLDRFYQYWRDEAEFLVFKHEKLGKYIAVKCSKRGNDVYESRIEKRLGWLRSNFPNVEFFDEKDFKVDSVVKTRVIWITLTHDHRIESTRDDSWRAVGKHWNCFISALRRRYGRISVFRAWDRFETDSFVHIHAVLLFHDHEFQVFKWINAEGETEYRLHEKNEIAELWHSFVDIKAIHSTKAVLKYACKYQFSKVDGGFNPRLLALLWLHRKRSFSVSGEFREKISDLITVLNDRLLLTL